MFFKDFHFLIKKFETKIQKSFGKRTNSNIRKISKEQQKAFFDRLRTARIEANLTQAQVAKKLGRHQSYISKIESGEHRLLIEDFCRLFRLYNKPPEYFYSVFSK
ncbi:helix-turn-helix transcriptional regulator [Leptospira sp. 201903070]|uniref:Helix-turn-helix transcriptional regulator n=1 Tax=Leptospira ainlahdjerensis TaxID=2810033 RepID=A0ABS2U788_9LEPT|nr:helix-turn-helix transcriptional regulator [Leptospira ainlahdjerensis]MBM9576225.1 helix-turn-helix transcriptional regulator [Leptospira ainlahdjerensis]